MPSSNRLQTPPMPTPNPDTSEEYHQDYLGKMSSGGRWGW